MVGKDKGKQGKIREVARSKNWVFVQNMNLVRLWTPPGLMFTGGFTYLVINLSSL